MSFKNIEWRCKVFSVLNVLHFVRVCPFLQKESTMFIVVLYGGRSIKYFIGVNFIKFGEFF